MISLVSEGQLLPAVLWFSLLSFDLVGAWELSYIFHCGSDATILLWEQCYIYHCGSHLFWSHVVIHCIVGVVITRNSNGLHTRYSLQLVLLIVNKDIKAVGLIVLPRVSRNLLLPFFGAGSILRFVTEAV